ncbi:hypothetical protein Tco_0150742 [Tanacetum coccineum]
MIPFAKLKEMSADKELLQSETNLLQELSLGKSNDVLSEHVDESFVLLVPLRMSEGLREKRGSYQMIARKKPIKLLDEDSDDEHFLYSSPDGDYLVIYRANGNFRAFKLYDACRVCILELEDGIVIHMLVERDISFQGVIGEMLDLDWKLKRESKVALDLISFIKNQIDEE